MSPPPPQQPLPPPHHHPLKNPTSLSDVIFTAFSLFILFSTSPKPTSIFFLPNNKLSFALNARKFLKFHMSLPLRNHPNPSRLPPPPFATPQSLSEWLRPRLPSDSFASWGVKPGTKNIHNLWLEIAEGETSLADSTPPVRTVEVVIVRVTRKNDNKILVESHQELSNGSVRYRCRPLSEKMKPGESVEAAVFRAVKEELGSIIKIVPFGNSDDNVCNCISNNGLFGNLGNAYDSKGIIGMVKILPGSYAKKVEERVSASYPGLPACYLLHTVDAEVEGLPEGEFSTEEVNEYGDSNESSDAVSCKKHYWKWVDSDSV